jgi:predicted DNA-binding protein YlxM (UPF0122 family)
MDMYYNEDLSLAEIAAEIGISRQGARDIIKKSEEELIFFEEKLGLAKKLQGVSQKVNELKITSCRVDLPQDFREKLDELKANHNVVEINVIKDGKVAEAGNHEELLGSCDVYREIYVSQMKGGDDNG